MQMIKDVCKRTETPTGQIVVGASVLLLGLGHFGKDSGLMNIVRWPCINWNGCGNCRCCSRNLYSAKPLYVNRK